MAKRRLEFYVALTAGGVKPTGNDGEMQFTLSRTAPDEKSHESHWTRDKDADGKIHAFSVNMKAGATDLLWTSN